MASIQQSINNFISSALGLSAIGKYFHEQTPEEILKKQTKLGQYTTQLQEAANIDITEPEEGLKLSRSIEGANLEALPNIDGREIARRAFNENPKERKLRLQQEIRNHYNMTPEYLKTITNMRNINPKDGDING